MSEWTILGERLSHIMREYDVSLRELSRRTGITLTTLHRYATCKRVPRATEILKCANALGITCDYLLGLSDVPLLTGKGERIKANKMNNDLISRQAALEKIRAMQTYKLFKNDDMLLVDKAEVQTGLMMLPPVQPEVLACGNGELVVKPEPSILLSWVEKYIEWLKSFDNEFANLEAAHISVMVKKWRDEQDETD